MASGLTGPSSTESRWAPTTVVRSGLPVGLSAIRLYCTVSVVVASTANVSVRVEGTARGAPLRGTGYLELVGYARAAGETAEAVRQ